MMEGTDPVEDAQDPMEDLRTAERWLRTDLQETMQTITAKERELQVLCNRLTFLRTELAHLQQQIAKAALGVLLCGVLGGGTMDALLYWV